MMIQRETGRETGRLPATGPVGPYSKELLRYAGHSVADKATLKSSSKKGKRSDVSALGADK